MQAERLPVEALDTLVIARGGHTDRSDGLCSMELVSWLAGEAHSAAPNCACPVLTSFVVGWNDGIRDDITRTRMLKPFLPRLIGTRATADVESRRRWMLLDWLIRGFTPAWLDLRGSLKIHADALRSLGEIKDRDSINAARPAIDAAKEAAYAAWAAAWAAARDAAWAAAGDAAWDAAGDAAWAAARDAAWAAAGDAAWDAAWAAAGDAAWDAGRDAAWAAARDAARAAAGDALAETVTRCQESACHLLDRMIETR